MTVGAWRRGGRRRLRGRGRRCGRGQSGAGDVGVWWGGLELGGEVQRQEAARYRCASCARPCTTACPGGAVKGKQEDVEACRSDVGWEPGQRGLAEGCLARRACPISQAYDRDAAQSASHMREFLN